MREAEFWARLRALVGDDYAATWADSVAHTSLGSRTAVQALAEGADVRSVWWAVCEILDVPVADR